MSDNNILPWKKLTHSVVFETPWFKIFKEGLTMPNGARADYYVHDSHDGALCVCVTEDGKFLLVEQYRPAVEKVSIDYPAGGVESEDLHPEAAAKREVEEETGYTVGSIKKLATLDRDPSFSRTKMHIFLAQDLRKDGIQHLDATEDLRLKVASAEDIRHMIDDDRLNCSFCVAATYLAFRELGI